MNDPRPEEIQPNGIYTAANVARIVFRRSNVRWFWRNHRRLEAEGFPQPISRVGLPRWSGRALLAWIDRARVFAPVPGGARGDTVVSFSAELRARGARIAAGGRR